MKNDALQLNVDLVNDNVYTKFGLIPTNRYKLGVEQIQMLTQSKVRTCVANLQKKMMLYNPDIDLVDTYVYTKFELIPFIRFNISRENKTKLW